MRPAGGARRGRATRNNEETFEKPTSALTSRFILSSIKRDRPPRPARMLASLRRPTPGRPATRPTLSARRKTAPRPPRSPQPLCATSALSEPESAALAAFEAASDPAALAASTLRRAASTRDADGDAVLGALAHALTAASPLPGSAPPTPAALAGRPWRLVFSAPAPLPSWRYIPVPEFFALPPSPDAPGPVCLSSDVGPLHFAFSGVGRFLPGEGACVLEFCFARADVQWGADAPGPFLSRPLGDPATKPKKTYTFFAYLPAAEEGKGRGGVEVACARSLGGALSLLARRA